jgi:ABC-type microcin C transport system duplicated ATPase subunit YejF
VIAHRLTTIRNAHQIYVLDNGSVIEEGTHETLMAKEEGKYQAMVKRQQLGRISDDEDSLMNMEQMIEEDQQSICMLIL